jgi:hypothetical protein
MKNFQLIARGIDTSVLYNAIMRQPELWDVNTLRTTHPQTPHKAVSDIWLRFNEISSSEKFNIDEHESVNYPANFALPQARPLIFGLMARVEGERLGRVLITKLAPGGRIDPHVDGGAHAEYYDRYHIVISAGPGSLFRAGDEQVQMLTGEVWWFDNSKEHEVINNSADDRVHLIVDIRTTR